MKIELESIKKVYELAKKVHFSELSRGEAIKISIDNNWMGKGSTQDYIQNFKYLMEGFVYKRTMNLAGTEYFLRQIHHDFGLAAFTKSLRLVSEHVTYYNSLGHSRQVQTQKLIEDLIQEFSINIDEHIFPDEVVDETIFEGAKKQITVNTYERSREARNLCIEYYGVSCFVCDFNFEKTYGSIGTGFIHVHHVVDLAQIGKEYKIDPIKDLRPVCPNCHAMLHRTKPALSINSLKKNLGLK
ncbi:HNH endonuclease [Psychrosphaera sp. 1_MG-2023]|uniref:HNH endonuclease n=1 Tax=Psychrosphaera sp. 1_MG-2023 TaxID=3062643 RepID=UPI0026E441BA|nr:HNH endonuclease [Psychrosphaera sp. 1_MG-2023]MDO6721581.1 HNH endonuclease [Psychrosphaera sp. 1_MG-2023]